MAAPATANPTPRPATLLRSEAAILCNYEPRGAICSATAAITHITAPPSSFVVVACQCSHGCCFKGNSKEADASYFYRKVSRSLHFNKYIALS